LAAILTSEFVYAELSAGTARRQAVTLS